jgi:hypothetical protein
MSGRMIGAFANHFACVQCAIENRGKSGIIKSDLQEGEIK